MKKYILTFLAGALLVGAIVIGLWFSPKQNTTPRSLANHEAIIKQIQSLNRLETASYSVDKIIEIGTGYDQFKEFFFGEKLLLVAHGTVVAGIDLSDLDTNQIQSISASLTLTLPPPQILTVVLDNQKTKVFDRRQGILTRGDITLETTARQQAEAAIRQAACDGGVFDTANVQAKKQLELLLKATGYKSVEILTQVATCK